MTRRDDGAGLSLVSVWEAGAESGSGVGARTAEGGAAAAAEGGAAADVEVDAEAVAGGGAPPAGRLRLRLANASGGSVALGRLCLTSQLHSRRPEATRGARRVALDGTFQAFEPDGDGAPADASLEDGAVWEIELSEPSFRPAHANDGPTSAWLERGDGSVVAVSVAPMRRIAAAGLARADGPTDGEAEPDDRDAGGRAPDVGGEVLVTGRADADAAPGLVPWPNDVRLAPGPSAAPRALTIAADDTSPLPAQAWLVERTRSMLFPEEPPRLPPPVVR